MIKYNVKRGFMAYQFERGAKFSVGLECKALDRGDEYEITIGVNTRTKYYIRIDRIQEIIKDYKLENVIRVVGGKELYIIPVCEMKKVIDEGPTLKLF